MTKLTLPYPEVLVAVRNATNTISIVAIDLESDPLVKVYVKSLSRPGGNITGIFLDLPELSGKQIGLLKEIVPHLSRIAIFGVPDLNAAQFAAAETAVQAVAIEAEVIEVRVPDDFDQAFDAARAKHVEAGILLFVSPRIRSVEANRRAGAGQAASPHLFVRRVSKRPYSLWAERSRLVPKMRGLRRQNPKW